MVRYSEEELARRLEALELTRVLVQAHLAHSRWFNESDADAGMTASDYPPDPEREQQVQGVFARLDEDRPLRERTLRTMAAMLSAHLAGIDEERIDAHFANVRASIEARGPGA